MMTSMSGSWMARSTRKLLAAALIVGAAGCVAPIERIAVVEGTEQEDIPVPRSFEFERSYSPAYKIEVEGAKFRSWCGHYRGGGHLGDLVPWYVTEMQAHGWQYRGLDPRRDARKLYFEKGEEVSIIEISEVLDVKLGQYINAVRAEIHPRGPEDFSPEEHLASRAGGQTLPSAPAPASFKTSPARGQEKAGAARPSPKHESDVDEIDGEPGEDGRAPGLNVPRPGEPEELKEIDREP